MRNRGRYALSRLKIKKPQALKKILSGFRKKGERIVFTNGCFDLLHYGHVRYLEAAKKKGDVLVVALNSDSSIKRIKGRKRPIINKDDRAGTIAALESVDYVTVFDEDTPLKIIKLLRPDIIVKGADWNHKNIVGADFVRSYGGKVDTLKLSQGRSTTAIIEKIVKDSQD
ncbi:MAG: D-glycero-beta-D-manno-heptose 1-phosphate adenylyltransferase [Candidatus Omnitrophota bacterium]